MPEQDDYSAEGIAAPRQDERLSSPYADGPRARLGQKSAEPSHDDAEGVRHGGAFAAILGHDPATRKLMGFALALVVILLLVAGIWSLFGQRHQGIPVIGPPAFAVKERPADPGGMQIMSDDTAHSDVTGKGAVHLAPPPEQPDARVLARREDPPAQNTSTAPPHEEASSSPSPRSAGATAEPSAPSHHDVPSQPVSPSAAGSPASEHPASPPVSAPDEKPVRAQQRTDAQSSSRAQDTKDKGRYQVQLGALDSQAKAERAWASFRAKAADIVEGHTPRYQPVSRDGKNFVRLRVGGFPDFKSARLFCARLHAQSLACAPVAF